MRDEQRPTRARAIAISAALFLLAANISQARYSGGSGEPNNPYRIATPNDLNDIGNHVEDFNKSFVMVNDVDLAHYTGTQFNIIGPNIAEPFSGVFDGDGHTISNFTYHTTAEGVVGVFGVIGGCNAEIRNLYLLEPNIILEDGDDAGTLAAGVWEGRVQSCGAQGGIVRARNFVGGLVGTNSFRGIVESCFATTDVNGDMRIGGLVGQNYHEILDCYTRGQIEGNAYVGGLVGSNSARISNCQSDCYVKCAQHYGGGLVGENYNGTVENSAATGLIVGDFSIGGLVGFSFSESMVRGSYANCVLDANNAVGGLVGYSYYGSGISDSYSVSTVDGIDAVGGLAGVACSTSIDNCYSAAPVSGDSNVGAFCGFHCQSDTVYSGAFWDSVISPDINGIGNGSAPNVVGKPTVEMQTDSTFTDAGWDFVGETANGTEDIWDICQGTNYPRLVWQIPAADFLCPDGVNFIDYSYFGSAWNTSDPNADLNLSGLVNHSDLKIFCEQWLDGI